MRTLIVSVGLVAGLALSACSSTGADNRYETALRRLADDCQARGGILVPAGPQSTGRPETDNACRLTSASRIP